MNIKAISKLTGKINSRDIPVTELELHNWRSSGKAVQNAFPHLSDDDREFLISGITPEEWEATFGTGEE